MSIAHWVHHTDLWYQFAAITKPWTLWRLESLTTLLIVQQLLHVNITSKKTKCPYYRPFVRRIHQSPVVPPTKDHLCWKCTILIEIMQKVIPGNKTFSDGIFYHYSDVIMSTVASPITSFTIVYSTVYSGKGERDQSSTSLAFVRGIHWWPVNSPHKGPVMRKMFPFDDVIMWGICITGLQGIHSCSLAVSQLT